MLPVYRYEGLEPLLATLAEKVIAPAEDKVRALAERRRTVEAKADQGSLLIICATKLLTRDEARRIAVNIAELPNCCG